MYKSLKFEEIIQIKTTLFSTLKSIYEKEGYTYFKQYIKDIFNDFTEEVVYCNGSSIVFRIVFKGDVLEIIDEKQNIKLVLTDKDISKVHNYLKKRINVTGRKDIANSLEERFLSENMKKYLGKHFLVYDIETIGGVHNLKEIKFMIGYVIDSFDFEKGETPKYKYINQKNLDKFVEYLVNYDGYIVGYNNIAFDNQVIVYNSSFDNKEEIIKKINEKSLDLFEVCNKIFRKKLGLNTVATKIVGISKSLSSGAEGEELLKLYEKTKEQKILTKVKNYCKNDVKMTLAILLYLLFNGEISYQGEEIKVLPEDLIKLGTINKNTETSSGLF